MGFVVTWAESDVVAKASATANKKRFMTVSGPSP
jgi:hypothetical protein